VTSFEGRGFGAGTPSGSGMLLPIAPAFDADAPDAVLPRLSIRAFVRLIAVFGILAGEFLVLRLHVGAHGQQFVNAFLVALGITAGIGAISFLPAFQWLHKPLRPSFESSRIRRGIAFAMLQLLVCVTWITRDMPATPWFLALVVVPIAAEPIVRSIAGLRHRSGRTQS